MFLLFDYWSLINRVVFILFYVYDIGFVLSGIFRNLEFISILFCLLCVFDFGSIKCEIIW